jgi:hypothetical protein
MLLGANRRLMHGEISIHSFLFCLKVEMVAHII